MSPAHTIKLAEAKKIFSDVPQSSVVAQAACSLFDIIAQLDLELARTKIQPPAPAEREIVTKAYLESLHKMIDDAQVIGAHAETRDGLTTRIAKVLKRIPSGPKEGPSADFYRLLQPLELTREGDETINEVESAYFNEEMVQGHPIPLKTPRISISWGPATPGIVAHTLPVVRRRIHFVETENYREITRLKAELAKAHKTGEHQAALEKRRWETLSSENRTLQGALSKITDHLREACPGQVSGGELHPDWIARKVESTLLRLKRRGDAFKNAAYGAAWRSPAVLGGVDEAANRAVARIDEFSATLRDAQNALSDTVATANRKIQGSRQIIGALASIGLQTVYVERSQTQPDLYIITAKN